MSTIQWSVVPDPKVYPDDVLVITREELATIREACSSCAIEGNALAAEVAETCRRISVGEPCGSRYLKQLEAFRK